MTRNVRIPILAALGALLVTAAPVAAQSIDLPRGSTWKYEDSGTALPPEWKDVGYADGTWSFGPAILGYGETYVVTTVSFGPDPNNKHITTYFRATFDLQDAPAQVHAMLLRANYDDGVVVYLNGQEVARLSMPAGPIGYGTFASSHEGGGYETIDLSAFTGLLTPAGNVLAAEVHQTTLNSTDLVLDLELETSTLPATVTRGPYLQIGRPEGVSVRWRTSAATDARVWYGPSPASLTWFVDDPSVQLDHVVAVDGLQPDTRYYYAIGTTTTVLAGGDSDHHFETSPPVGSTEPVRLWAIGDSGQPGAGQDAVRDTYLAYPGAERTDLWLMLGDNAYDAGTEPQYAAAVFGAYPSLLRTVPLWPTRGNHDVVRAGDDNDYLEFFTLPTMGEAGGVASGTEAYYSFDFANLHLVCLDTEGSSLLPAGPMVTWLRQDLAANTADWTILYFHHPPYTKGSHDSDDPLDSGGRMRDVRLYVLPVADSLGVDLVLAGHSHSYERSVLLDGHYGTSGTLTGAMILDGGDGRSGGDGAYTKATTGPAMGEGCVYLTAGNGSKLSGGALNHPVMYTSLNVLGSLVLDIAGPRLDLTFLDDAGATRDSFTIVKGAVTAAARATPEIRLGVSAGPSPFRRGTEVRFTLPRAGAARVRVIDTAGRAVRTLAAGERTVGEHCVRWDGRDDAGRAVAAGIYLVTLEQGGELRATKVVHTR